MRQGITLGDDAFPMLLCLPLALGFLLDDPLFFQLFRYKRRYSKPVKRCCETRGTPRTCGRWWNVGGFFLVLFFIESLQQEGLGYCLGTVLYCIAVRCGLETPRVRKSVVDRDNLSLT